MYIPTVLYVASVIYFVYLLLSIFFDYVKPEIVNAFDKAFPSYSEGSQPKEVDLFKFNNSNYHQPDKPDPMFADITTKRNIRKNQNCVPWKFQNANWCRCGKIVMEYESGYIKIEDLNNSNEYCSCGAIKSNQIPWIIAHVDFFEYKKVTWENLPLQIRNHILSKFNKATIKQIEAVNDFDKLIEDEIEKRVAARLEIEKITRGEDA